MQDRTASSRQRWVAFICSGVLLAGGSCGPTSTRSTRVTGGPVVRATEPTDASQPTAVTGALSVVAARRIQSQVMDFTDDLTIRLAEATDVLEQSSHSVEARVVAHRLKYTVAHGATVIATAINPQIALADMLVMISIQRALIERNLKPRFFPESGDRLLAEFTAAEREVRVLAAAAFTAEQLGEIDRQIARWLEENPDRRYAAYVRLSDFDNVRQAAAAGSRAGINRPTSVLGFLFIDPFAGLDPTTRELQQSRLLAERAFFWLQRMPVLVSWQAELLFIDTVSEPETRQLIENARTVTESLDRTSRDIAALRGEIPEIVNAERTAAIEQFRDLVDQQRTRGIDQAFERLASERQALLESLAGANEPLAATLAELRTTIDAGTALSQSLQQTAESVSGLARTLRLDEPPSDDDAPAASLADYTEAIRETTRAATELARLTDSLAAVTAPEVLESRLLIIERRLANAEASADRILARAFRLGMLLVVAMTLGAASVVVLSWVLRGRQLRIAPRPPQI